MAGDGRTDTGRTDLPRGICTALSFFEEEPHATGKRTLPDQKEFREEGGAPTDRPPGIKNLVSRFFGHPCISGAFSWYYNPDLPEKNRLMPDARTSPDGITLVYSDGSATAKVTLKTTATSPEQQSALIAELYSLLP